MIKGAFFSKKCYEILYRGVAHSVNRARNSMSIVHDCKALNKIFRSLSASPAYEGKPGY